MAKGRWENVPIHPDNRPREPTTRAELDQWIAATRDALKKWLGTTRTQAQDNTSVSSALGECTSKLNDIWAVYEPTTDVQTGLIHDIVQNSEMETAMAKAQIEERRLHKSNQTWYKHLERRYADGCWEDFLYYQNMWNRKRFIPEKEYHETYAEKQQAKAGDKETNDSEIGTRTRSKAKGTTEKEHPKAPKAKPPAEKPWKPGKKVTVPLSSLDRSDDSIDGGLGDLYLEWRKIMITLYDRFKLGDRKQIPAVVDPDDAHRYSQPPRGTSSRATSPFKARSEYLKKAYPRRKRKTAGQSEDMNFELDEEATKKRVKENDERQDPETVEFTQNTKKLLPTEHVTYHASKGTSFDWPTSFEPEEWGNQILRTMDKKEYIYENDSDVADLPDSERDRRRDDTNGRIRQVEKKPRYDTVVVGPPRKVEKFFHARNPDGSVQRRDKNGQWPGKVVERTEDNIDFEMVGGKRKESPARFTFKRRFRTVLNTVEERNETRKTVHKIADKMHELSDSEDEDRTKSSVYYKWSGNAKLGGTSREGDRSEDGSVIEIGSGPSDGESEVDSEDNGDLFRRAYEEGVIVTASG
jgi:hypothetical protein